MSIILDPLTAARLGALFFSFTFSVIGGSVGLNALVKSNQERSYIRNAAASMGASVSIDVSDVFSTGAVITTVCALLSLISAASFAFTWCPIRDKRFGYRSQSCALFFCSIWLFVTLIPFDYFFTNREAQVSATLDGFSVSDNIMQSIEQVLGVTPVYKDIDYLRLVAVLPWFSLIFSVIAGVVLHKSARREGVADDASPGELKKIETQGQV
ncbi:hypothetical protein PAXRUDRAFT_457573 [Paxillus rubicundulus Ve08.2h10]|uniref:Uncharacterized protein n=1 Tax=Paxillus rubicundulus Ve08.2h10 TaxID=930991 RepID=A0A0D0DB21_9AGAM|nr:hypothetical protein PAXRUDRAFT_457573 [Paxillus rubicundulus Ve08.2h10]